MVFNSFQFLWLFPLIFFGYYGLTSLVRGRERLKHRVGNGALLFVSYALYMQWRPAYALLLLGVTAVTFLAALHIARAGESRRRRVMITAYAALALMPLAVFKYYDFINNSVGDALAAVGIGAQLPGLNWAVPLGISFFTFQAVGYLFDVYYRRIEAETSWWDYMLFVSFFPQILSGPISRASDLLPQIKAQRAFSCTSAVAGLKMLLWGMFLKTVLADRLGLYVDTVFANWQYNSGITCLAASVAYSFQIYGDFAGYSLMAVGTGRLLGFDLANNFRRPYLAVSVTDFWRRWHITLSTWLRDYVYIPLGGSRRGRLRTYANIVVTFLVSGVWHGANWTFIAWGVLHGAMQVVEKALGLQRCDSRRLLVRLPRIVVTFALINFAWTLFRAPTLADGCGMLARMFTASGGLYIPSNSYVLFTATALTMTLVTEYLEEFRPGRFELLNNRRTLVRWAAYTAVTMLILLAGVLDSSQFIYVSF